MSQKTQNPNTNKYVLDNAGRVFSETAVSLQLNKAYANNYSMR